MDEIGTILLEDGSFKFYKRMAKTTRSIPLDESSSTKSEQFRHWKIVQQLNKFGCK